MTTTSKHRLIAVLAGAAGIGLLAGAASANVPPAAGEPSVLVFDQRHKGASVTISYAYLPKKGYAVIYGADAAGKPMGQPLAHVPLDAGDHRDITVKLNEDLQPGTKLWASLYEDRDGKQGFVKGADVSFWPDGKLPMENAFTVR